MATCIRRRELIVTPGGVTAWPITARAPQPVAKMPRIGIRIDFTKN
jgi:hypothetical protein